MVIIWLYYEFTCKFWMHWTPISRVEQFFILWCKQNELYALQKVISRVESSWFDHTMNSDANSECIEPQFLMLNNFFIQWCEENKFYALQKVISWVEWSWFDCTMNSHANSECIEPQFLVLDNFLFYGVLPIVFYCF